jgi:hypothetical protein
MPLVQIVLVLIVVGVLLGLINRYIPMAGSIKSMWSSSSQSIVAYGQRKQVLRGEVQKAFERLGYFQDPEPNTVVELGIRMSPK